jgi:hypothetical protein
MSRARTHRVPEERQLAAAAEWRLLALLFSRPRPGWREEIGALALEVRDPGLRAAASATRDAREGTYLRLMGPGGSVSPREVTYRPLEDPGWILADIARHYEAFAFRPCAEDPLDHIACETDFVAYLFFKEAFARARDDAEAARVTADARTQFLARHVATIAGPFAERLAGAGPAYLVETARLLAARVPTPPRPPAGLAARPESPQSSEGCGFCT